MPAVGTAAVNKLLKTLINVHLDNQTHSVTQISHELDIYWSCVYKILLSMIWH